MKPLIERWQLEQRLSLPLEQKIIHTVIVLEQALDQYDGNGYLSFSGGLDSTVLYHLIKKEGLDKRYDIKYVFADNQMEDERNRAFINTLDNIIVVRGNMTVKEIFEQDGYPIGSKLTSRKIRDLQNPTDNNAATRRLYEFGIKKDGTKGSPQSILPKKWHHLIDSPFKISEKCCNRLKKEPFKQFEKDSGIKLSITGERASESQGRQMSYLKSGCNNWRNHMSKPIAIWTDQNVLEYLYTNNLPFSSAYGEIIVDEEGIYYTTGESSTGCLACLYGFEFDKYPNRIQRIQMRNPKLHKWVLDDLGYRELMDYMGYEHSLKD